MVTNGILTNLIKEYYSDDSLPRDYIGASIIGSECQRQIWYSYKGYPVKNIPVKTQITWQIGKKIESMAIEILKYCGLHLIEQVPVQYNDYFKGTIDAIWLNEEDSLQYNGIIEIKSAKNSLFIQFKNNGLKRWSRTYYAQIQSYMGMSGIKTAYVLVINKDTSEFLDEKVLFDSDVYEQLCIKADIIKNHEIEPPRISNNPSWYQCKMCNYREVCHQ